LPRITQILFALERSGCGFVLCFHQQRFLDHIPQCRSKTRIFVLVLSSTRSSVCYPNTTRGPARSSAKQPMVYTPASDEDDGGVGPGEANWSLLKGRSGSDLGSYIHQRHSSKHMPLHRLRERILGRDPLGADLRLICSNPLWRAASALVKSLTGHTFPSDESGGFAAEPTLLCVFSELAIPL